MRGVSILIALGASLFALGASAPAHAAGLEALAAEKAAAVKLLKHRAETQVAIAAGDRLFAAYVNAASLAEGARITPRIEVVLKTLLGRYGIREIAVADRAGTFLVRLGRYDAAQPSLDPKKDAALQGAFATGGQRAASLQDGLRLDIVAPARVRGTPEFALLARQDFTSYRKALAFGMKDNRFVVLADAKGTVLADSRHGGAGTPNILNGLTVAALRKALHGAATGEVVAQEFRYRVALQPAGNWSVIALEPIPAPRRCYAQGARLCG